MDEKDDYELLYLKAYFLFTEQDNESARIYLQKIIKHKEDFNLAYILLASIDAKENKPDAAIQNIEKAVYYGYDEIEFIKKNADIVTKEINVKIEKNRIEGKNKYPVYKETPLLMKINIQLEAELYSSQEL